MSPLKLQNVFRAARPARTCDAATFIRRCRAKPLHQSNFSAYIVQPQQTSAPPARRSFSTTKCGRATVVAQNPRQDEDGNEMTITISDRAAKRLQKITSSSQSQRNTLTSNTTTASESHLRVAVTSGGCHGFQYLMSLEPSDKIDPEEDTVFVADSIGNDSGTDGKGSAKVVLDESSLELLKGSTVDFTTELIGSQFKIVGNPRATSSCGCGTSFDIE